MARQKLEITWIDKDQRAWLQPPVSVQEPARSYHAKHQAAHMDVLDKQPNKGDNHPTAQQTLSEATQDDFFGRNGA
jgi:adenine-specific DNA-methyltransferase